MKIPCIAALVVLFSLSTAAVQAQDENSEPEESAEIPVITSDYIRSPDEPQIVITGDEDATIYEYRVKGELREIKVEPRNAPAYYLVPAEGGGWIRETESQLLVPSWVLFSW
ncbi:MAG: DUF2782 domain-containing protein [Oleiphilaceae bacterium]|nr:DUF2782 domain-containing protein [Oleiphilaceae bacterium]